MNRLIIITTVVNRPQIHRLSFPSYFQFLQHYSNIKWCIHIDYSTDYPDTLQSTEQNLRQLLAHYDCLYFTNEKGHFYQAVYRLLEGAQPYLTDDCYVLWLEDDWLLNKEITLDYFLPLVKQNTVLSLVYNMIGSFPPFIMGSQISRWFFQTFLTKPINHTNPEKMSRKIMKNLCAIHGCIYYNYLDTLTTDNCSTSDHLRYTENSFAINDCRILSNNTMDNCALIVENVTTYLATKQTKIIFIRLGIASDHKNYQKSVFKDLGRIYKKNNLKI